MFEPLSLPPIYPITDPGLERPLADQVRRLGRAGFPLVQFRGKPLDAKAQWLELRRALGEAADEGGWPMIVVNDRADLAVLAAAEGLPPWGLHLGQEDLPPGEAHRLPGLDALHLGTSTHGAEEWATFDPACDHAGIGPFRATRSKGDHAPPIGLEGLRAGCTALRARMVAPIAIGGLTLAEAAACFEAGAESLAMIGAVAAAEQPSELLWEAQCQRWRVRPPLHPGQGVLLVGGSGTGKSTLAKALAFRLGLNRVDLDAEIALAAGMSITELFESQGEAAFRALETACLRQALMAPCLIDGGGGLWESAENRQVAQESGTSVLWIAERPELAWERVAQDPHRPLTRDRRAFMARWRSRMATWSGLPMVLPLGRDANTLAEALLG